MLYSTLKIKSKEYKLRLGMKGMSDLQKDMGKNPLNQEEVGIEDLVKIIKHSMVKYQHNITEDKVWSLVEDLEEEEGLAKTMEILAEKVTEVFEIAGFSQEKEPAEIVEEK